MDLWSKLNFVSGINGETEESNAALICVQCKDNFQSAWDLMVHAQAAHMVNIYELGVRNGHIDHHQLIISPNGQEIHDSPSLSPNMSPTPNSPTKVSLQLVFYVV